MKGYARENTQEITAGHSALRKCRNAVSAGVLSPISSAVGRNGAVGDKESARAGARNSPLRRLRAGRGRFTPLRGDTSSAPFGGTCLPAGRSVRGSDTPPACHSTPRTPQGEGLRVRHSHRGPLKGKANGGVSFNAANPSRGRLTEACHSTPRPIKGKANGGVSFNTATHQGGRLTPAGGGRKKDRRGRSFCLLFGCTAYWDLFCSFWSMAVNSGGRGQWSSTGSPVRGWTKRRPAAWRHWPVRPGTGFLAP